MTISNVVVDLSHHNRVADFRTVKADGIEAVIHKATQGFRYRDPKYADRRGRALGADLLWGAYHFGVSGDGIAQAEHFLAVVGPQAGDLLVLDFEPNPSGGDMTVDEAEDFVVHVYGVTGRWPGLYSGGYYLREKLRGDPDTILSNCWLWLAQWGPVPRIPGPWSTWVLWQYTDGAIGPEPHVVAGIGHCDRDKFNGDLDALGRFWRNES